MSALSPILGAAKYLPASLGVKLLEKVNPKFKNYFTQAAAYGFDANQALDYLKGRFENEGAQAFQGRLEQGRKQGQLRPDEAAALSQLETSQLPGKAVRSLASYGGAALAGLPGIAAQAASDVAETVEPEVLGKMKGEHIPGLGQVREEHVPGLGQFRGEHGPSSPIDEIKKLDPNVGNFIQKMMNAGQPPMQAAAIARNVKELQKPISKVEKKLGQNIVDWISAKMPGGQGQQQGMARSQQAVPSPQMQAFNQGLNRLADMLKNAKR